MIRDFKVGDEITLVSKGVRRSYGQTWIDETMKGSTSFFIVEKVGMKYIYGKHIFFENNGNGIERKTSTWQDKMSIQDHYVFRGLRQDLKQKHADFITALRNYEEAERKQRYTVESELRDVLRSRMEEWRKLNPRPVQADPKGDLENEAPS